MRQTSPFHFDKRKNISAKPVSFLEIALLVLVSLALCANAKQASGASTGDLLADKSADDAEQNRAQHYDYDYDYDEEEPDKEDDADDDEAEAEEGMIGFAHRIEVNIPAMELSLLENGFKIKTYQLAIGKKTHQTPEQESEIHFIEWNPSWYPPKYSYWAKDEQETPPGPDNPIGIAKLPLLDDILFHGTNDESSIGQASSHGCLRMKNQDITELAWFLQSRYSQQSQNWWPSIYKKNLHRTYVVKLDQKIPVTLKYETATIQNGKLKIYPDYYQKLTNKNTAAILAAFHKAKISLQSIDAEKVEEVANNWQTKEIKLADMMLTPDKPSLAPAPECS